MSSYVCLRLESLQKRFDEIDLLLNYASKNEHTNDLYCTLCRSAQIFIVAHFEGAIKDIVRDVLDDFNNSEYEFKDSPEAIKRTFCNYFLENEDGRSNEKKLKKLYEVFDSLPVKYGVDPFLYSNSENNNKNPSPHVVERIMEKFGVTFFLTRIYNSDLDVAFEDSKSDMINLRDRLRQHLMSALDTYPYKIDLDLFNISSAKCKKETNSLWFDFLETIQNYRHKIAHGNTLENLDSHTNIAKTRIQVEILIYAFIMILCKYAIPKNAVDGG
jgi:hypothetical protein